MTRRSVSRSAARLAVRAGLAVSAAAVLLLAAGCERRPADTPPAETPAPVPAPPSTPPAGDPAPVPPGPPAPGRDFPVAALSPSGLGPLRIGMTVAEAAAVLGGTLEPDSPHETDACRTHASDRLPRGVSLLSRNGRVARISLSSDSAVVTNDGVGIGTGEAELISRYGGALERETHHYLGEPAEYLTLWSVGRARGLRFETDQNERVFEIHAGDDAITLVESCA